MSRQVQNTAAVALAVVGLVSGVVGAMWLTSMGVAYKTADAIATAVSVGSWGMFLVAIAATGGIVGIGLWGALRLIAARAGKAAVVA